MLSLCTLHARALVSACLLINASLLVASPSIADAPIIFARYKGRTAHIETIGTLFNGKSQVGSGSGLLISAKHVVTNNHVIPLESNYKSLSVNVRLGSRDSIFVSAYKIYRDAERDLALIELEKPLMASGCPLLVAKDPPVTIAEGTALYALGYPVDQDLSITDGILSNKKAAHRRWQMSVLVNPGNSGGPIFTNIGQLIGFSVSGIVQWKIGGELRDVTGVNFLIPISELVSSPIFANLNGIPENERCWDETASAVPLAGPPPTAFQQSFKVDLTNDEKTPLSRAEGRTLFRGGLMIDVSDKSEPELFTDFLASGLKDYQIRYPKVFTPTLTAAQNYRFDSVEPPRFALDSLNPPETPLPTRPCNAENEVDCYAFTNDRRSVTFRLRLFAGWQLDATRGWIHGDILMRELLDR